MTIYQRSKGDVLVFHLICKEEIPRFPRIDDSKSGCTVQGRVKNACTPENDLRCNHCSFSNSHSQYSVCRLKKLAIISHFEVFEHFVSFCDFFSVS